MKKLTIFIIIFLSMLIAACDSPNRTSSQPASETENNSPGAGRPTPTSENRTSESIEIPVPYPGVSATATAFPEDYPAPQQIPTNDPYPAGMDTTWVLYPVGTQCEDASTSKYQSEQDAKAGLTAVGITVHTVTTTELMVCAACGCPTSAHFRIEINAIDLDKATLLGWESE